MPAARPDAALSAADAAAAAAVTADADAWAIDLANELAAAAIEQAIATAYGPTPTTAPVTRWLLSAKVADGVASALRLFGPLSCRSTSVSGASGDGAGDSNRWSSLDGGGTTGGSTRDSDAAGGGSSSLSYPMMLAMLPTLFPPRAGGLLSIAPRPRSLDDSEACGALAARSIIRRALLAADDEAAPQGSEPTPPPPVLIEEMD